MGDEFLLCEDTGNLAWNGVCTFHNGDACLHRYVKMGSDRNRRRSWHVDEAGTGPPPPAKQVCSAHIGTWAETSEVLAVIGPNEAAKYSVRAPVETIRTGRIPDGVGAVRRGDRLMREEHHVLTCDRELHVIRPDMHYSRHPDDPDGLTTWWTDSMPGAVPHTPPAEEPSVVTGAEVAAAGWDIPAKQVCSAWLGTWTETDDVMAWLEGASYEALGIAVEAIPDGMAVVRRGDRLMRLDLHDLPCDGEEECDGRHFNNGASYNPGTTTWLDRTPGAVPRSDDEGGR